MIQDILGTPGLYRYENDAWCFFFEVDANGVVHQLKPPTLERDGVLAPDRWLDPSPEDKVALVFAGQRK